VTPSSDADARVLIVGAGPAGAALAQILASRGCRVTLVERQSDFEREFRGEVVMPSGLRVLEQMGLSAQVATLPQRRPERFELYRNRRRVLALDLLEIEAAERPLTLSQPHLLELLVAQASRHDGFRFVRGAVARELLHEGGRVCGLRLQTRDGEQRLRADLVIGADGRASVVRQREGFAARAIGTPMDVVWCKLPWPESFGAGLVARGYLGGGHLLIALPAPDGLLQVAWVILKGGYGELRDRGVEDWVRQMADHASPDLARHFRERAGEISRPFLLDARTERVKGWARPGVLLIGDAAHTMSPVGGQGINVALRDAVVAANHLVPALRGGATGDALDAVAARVEPERRPEIERIQRLAALPPRVVMRRGRAAELARALLLALATSRAGRRVARRQIDLFLHGALEVRLRV
jgi:2-polyprenyl-6-methoxyphenol hydroxylase-like FAD-dependent oxidoreductase